MRIAFKLAALITLFYVGLFFNLAQFVITDYFRVA